jgi:hypothetical protein
MEQSELDEIITKHQAWLEKEPNGVRATIAKVDIIDLVRCAF